MKVANEIPIMVKPVLNEADQLLKLQLKQAYDYLGLHKQIGVLENRTNKSRNTILSVLQGKTENKFIARCAFELMEEHEAKVNAEDKQLKELMERQAARMKVQQKLANMEYLHDHPEDYNEENQFIQNKL